MKNESNIQPAHCTDFDTPSEEVKSQQYDSLFKTYQELQANYERLSKAFDTLANILGQQYAQNLIKEIFAKIDN